MAKPKPSMDDSHVYKESYQTFSRTLRAWLVAYGIGAPVVLISQPSLGKVIADAKLAQTIINWFLVGVASQIFAAILYKAAMWYLMWGTEYEDFQQTFRYKVSTWVSGQLCLELAFDLVSIGAFAYATYSAFAAYLASVAVG